MKQFNIAHAGNAVDILGAYLDRIREIEREGWSADDAEQIAIDEANLRRGVTPEHIGTIDE